MLEPLAFYRLAKELLPHDEAIEELRRYCAHYLTFLQTEETRVKV